MIKASTKLRWRRSLKRQQRIARGLSVHTEESFDRHFSRRLGRLYEVRRFIFIWVASMVLISVLLIAQTRSLGNYYLSVGAVRGGVYSEGMLGSYTNSNPIFATGDVNMAVSKLIYSSLFVYDKNNNLVGGLAEKLSLDSSGKIYTIKLKHGLKWHDGKDLTSKDVAFTIRTIQNPDTKSPFFNAWQGVKIETPSDDKVVVKLKNPLASFPYSLTVGILPEHVLGNLKPSDLRSSLFNTIEPMGSGPFMWKEVEVTSDADFKEQRIALTAFDDYYAGKPGIDEFVVRVYSSDILLQEDFIKGKLNAVAGIGVPVDGMDNITTYDMPLMGSVMAFFNTASDKLTDVKVRRGLTMALDIPTLLKSADIDNKTTNGPLLSSHVGYNSDLIQYEYNEAQASSLLNESGWVADDKGTRIKDGVDLDLTLKTLNSIEYVSVAKQLQREWKKIGVSVNVESLSQIDLQISIDDRDYDILLYGVMLGADSDQFAYWHSSQADVLSQSRFNFSNYKSDTADEALVGGRTRLDDSIRKAKYEPFLRVWRDDAPAVALYQPSFKYTVYGEVFNFENKTIASPVDRFDNVSEWLIKSSKVIN